MSTVSENETPDTTAVDRQRLVSLLPNPFSDASNPSLWLDELTVLDRIAQGEKLVSERTYLEKRDTYAVSFYWQDAKYSAEYDVVVMRLLGRQAIRPVSYTHLTLPTKA